MDWCQKPIIAQWQKSALVDLSTIIIIIIIRMIIMF